MVISGTYRPNILPISASSMTSISGQSGINKGKQMTEKLDYIFGGLIAAVKRTDSEARQLLKGIERRVVGIGNSRPEYIMPVSEKRELYAELTEHLVSVKELIALLKADIETAHRRNAMGITSGHRLNKE